ncbi:MAG: class I SAM-dependent RNA methyltransferase, partial [Spirochaetaceae bacterium]|nr:class I SAM-dependent RNA methyltransferase [Spirochaetaceae bacterium]
PDCKYYGKCGGCNMRHIDSEYQKELRAQILLQLFENIDVENFQIISAKNDGYRCRMQLNEGGLKEYRSNNVIPITDCPMATDSIRQWLSSVPSEKRPKGRVQLFGDSRIINQQNSVLVASEEIPEQKQITGKTRRDIKNKVKKRFSGTVLSPENLCTIELLNKKITFDVRGFFQSNLEMLEKTVQQILVDSEGNKIKGKRALDIYSGAGTFSVFLADCFDTITLVEHNRDALVYAEQNLAGIPHESYGMSGERWATEYASKYSSTSTFDFAIVDPPRSGMENGIRKYLANSNIPLIKSVSCDPITHAKDCSYLVQNGYKLKALYLLDFYPQTCHIESLAVLEKV